jgi:hypothetical protein
MTKLVVAIILLVAAGVACARERLVPMPDPRRGWTRLDSPTLDEPRAITLALFGDLESVIA